VLLSDADVALSGESCQAAVAAFAEAVAPLVPPRGRIGVLLPPSAAQALAIAQVMASGRVPVVLDPWTPPGRLAEVCRRGRLHGLVALAGGAAGEEPQAPPAQGPPLILVDRCGGVAATRSGGADPAPLPPPGAALILNTSGSTGDPKAVVLPWEGLAGIVDFLIGRFGLGADTVAAVTLPLHHTMALNTQFLPTLLAGGRSVVTDAGLALGRTYRDLLASGATFVSLVSEMLRPCLLEKERRGLAPAFTVTEMQISGSMIHGEHLEMARELFPNARLHKGYGLTEAIRVTMIDSLHPCFGEPAAGFPLPGQEVIVRDERGRRLPAGARGRVCVRGPQVMLGYDGEGEQPFRDGFLETGDLGYLTEDGRLVLEGRVDGIFKSYGRRIAAAEIERAALRWPGVAAARCIAVPCPARGMRPVLFVEPEGRPGELRELEAVLKRELEGYKVPREIVLVEALPRSATGKIAARELERLWREGEPLAELGRGPLGCRFRRLDVSAPLSGRRALA